MSDGLVRYCPECGSIGSVSVGARDCCPDGIRAEMVPMKIAYQAAYGFQAILKRYEDKCSK